MRRQLLVLPGCLHENAGAAFRLTGRGIDSGVGRDREGEAADLPLVGGLLNVALDDAFERKLRDWLLLVARRGRRRRSQSLDRKSTRLNSSHVAISYAVLCLKKKRDAGQRTEASFKCWL